VNKKNPIITYFKSSFNITLIVITIIAIAAYFLFYKTSRMILIPISIFAVYIIITIIMIFSKRGAKIIVNEFEEDQNKEINNKIKHYEEIRNKISFLRIKDADFNKVIQLFLLNSGKYIDECKKKILYSPEANQKIEDVLEICQIYLEELDDSSTNKRYDLDNDEFTNYKEETIKSIKNAAIFINEKMETDLGGLVNEDKLKIMDELSDH
jgi:hypothetical protein